MKRAAKLEQKEIQADTAELERDAAAVEQRVLSLASRVRRSSRLRRRRLLALQPSGQRRA